MRKGTKFKTGRGTTGTQLLSLGQSSSASKRENSCATKCPKCLQNIFHVQQNAQNAFSICSPVEKLALPWIRKHNLAKLRPIHFSICLQNFLSKCSHHLFPATSAFLQHILECKMVVRNSKIVLISAN